MYVKPKVRAEYRISDGRAWGLATILAEEGGPTEATFREDSFDLHWRGGPGYEVSTYVDANGELMVAFG